MNSSRRILSQSIASALVALALRTPGEAQTNGTWTNLAGGSWPTTTNWAGGTVANGTDAIADFSTLNITANATVTLDGARTVGQLKFGDLTTASNDWILNTGTAGPLTLDVTTGQAVINVANRTATIAAVLAGTDGLNVTGNATGTSGTLILNAVNTFTGGLTITGAITQLNNAGGAGDPANVITIAAGPNTATANKLAINGGLTITNNIVIAAAASPLAGNGAVQQVGTGQAVVNGTITIGGATANGGHFVGGTASGNELVLNGVISGPAGAQIPAGTQVVVRDGRVILKGGGTGYTNLGVTGTAIVGVNDGISTAAGVQLGVSAAGTLDLGAFNQSITGLTLGGSGVGTVTGTTGVLTLNGNVTSSANFTHVINGNVNLGGASRDFTIGDGANAIDVQAGAAFSNGTLNKAGAGTLALNGANSALVTITAGNLALNGTSSAAVTATGGTLSGTGTVSALTTINNGASLSPGTATTAGTFTTNALTLGAGAALSLNVGTLNDLINVTAASGLTTGATTALRVVATGGPLAVGTTNLISHSGAIQGSGLAGFQLSGVGHATAVLEDVGSVLRLNVTQATGTIVWTGATNTTWDTTAANQNWKFQTGGAATSYLEGDDVRFADLTVPAATTVAVANPVTPSRVTIDNTAANTFTFTGSSIIGPTTLTKNGVGTAVFQNVLGYSGATTVSAGTLEMDFDTGGFGVAGTAVATSGISIATGATLRLTRDDADFTFDRSVSGTGTVLIDPHTAAGTASRTVTISGTNSGFSGTWKLSPSNLGAAGLGSFRTLNTSTNQTTLGTATIDVDPGGQLWLADNATITNNLIITGAGFAETAGGTPVGLGALSNGVYLGTGASPLPYAGIGAIRMGTTNTISGNILVDGNSKIMAFNQTGTISGNISSTSATDTLVIGGGTSATTVIFTGTNTYGKTFVNGGSGTSGVVQSLQIGNSGTTGTLGSGEVVLYGDSAATGRIVFQRGDGYTLGAGQNITGAASATANLVRTSVVVNNGGAGLTLNNNNVDLSDGVNGGNFSVGGTGNTLPVSGVVNILGSSLVDSGQLFLGDAANASGTVNQGGTSTVNFLSQMRVGHWPTETGTYNISGGTLNAGLPPTQFPFQTAGTQETNGGIYLGIDGTGVMVQSGGVINTNFLVLDNRADTPAGNNMSTGFDTFTQTGGKLVLNNAFGIISRNFSTAINLNGGTIQAGTGISPALDTNKIAVLSGGATLDTNGANTFTLFGPLSGTGTVALTNTGAGTGILNIANGGAGANNTAGGTMPGGSLGSAAITLAANTSLQATRTTGIDTWSGNIGGTGAFSKTGAGTLILTGAAGSFTGTTTVSAGRLDLPATFGSPTITVADGGALGGEPTVASVTLGGTTGAGLFINPATAASLTATNLTLNGTTTVDFSAPATTTTAAIPVIKYTTLTGAPTFALANAANYRSASFANAANTISLTLATKDLTWTGTGGANWDVNTTVNFNDPTPAAEKFFFGDRVTFGDGPTQVAVTVASGVSPFKTTVNAATNNYTFTSTTNGISGPGNLEKSGASTLTLVGPNTYTGKTVVSGGTLASATLATSLGNAGAVTNTIDLSGGARISDTGAVAFDLGPTRSIAIGAGGGSISHNNATAAAITISGNLTGAAAETLSFHSAAAGAGTFILTGNNSGLSSKITVDAPAAGLTALRFGTQSAVPAGGSITLNYPAAGANGNATTLDLPGITLPAAVTLNLTSFLNAAISLRSQITSNGDSAINGPMTLSGSSIIQLSPASGTLTVNGNITESAAGAFTGTLFGRGAGTTVFNGTLNLPTAGSTLAQTDAGTLVLNSTGNTFSAASALVGTFRIGANNAIPATATLNLGQNDGSSPNFNLNGFNQTFGGLVYTAGTGGTKTITNTATTLSTLTLNQATDVTMGGVLAGNLAFVKGGAGNLTLSNAGSTFTGDMTINAGTVTASALSAGTNGTLGRVNLAGRTVTLNNSGTTLAFTSNNIFGNGVNNANLPSVVVNGGTTLTSTRYNVLGPVTLNGGTLTQSATDSGAYEGFQFKGTITAGGTAASLISTGNGKADHLDANTTFNVADATGSSAVDLLVSAPLRDQSGDFGTAVGGLTKSGAGTLELSGTNTYTGASTVSAGVLLVTGTIGGATTVNTGGTLGGNGTVGAVNVVGGTLSPGTGPGTLKTGALSLDSASFIRFELAGNAGGGVNDLLSVAGNLTLDGTLQVTELSTVVPGTYRLFDYTGALTNNTLNLETGFLAAHPGSSINTATAGQINLTVVPEPGALMSLLGGMGLLVGLRRLRRSA